MMESRGGVISIDGVPDEEVDAIKEKLREIAGGLIDRERARLNAGSSYVWWADLVFATRDINGICNLMAADGHGDMASFLADIVGVACQKLSLQVTGGDAEKARELLDKAQLDGDTLDAVLEQVLREKMGEGTH